MKKIVLSDVDGTIVKGSLVLDHACSIHGQGIVDLGDLPDAWRENQKDETRIVALAEKYKEEITGLKQSELGVSKFLDNLFSDDEKFYSSLEQIKELRDNGAEVHLISGSPNFLLRPFAKRLGMNAAGSHYSRRRTGHFTGEVKLMALSDAKRNYVYSLDIKDSEVYAFGDTASDSPLFEVAHHSTLVDPSAETEKHFQGKVHSIIRN